MKICIKIKSSFFYSVTLKKPKHQMKGGFRLNVVVGKGFAVFQLLAGEDEALLLRWDTFLVLDVLLHVLNGIGDFELENDCITGDCTDEYLLTTAKPKHQMEGGFRLNVVVGESSAILKLLASED